MTNAEKYIQSYNNLEQSIKDKYKVSVEDAANTYLIDYKEELDKFRKIRNVIYHNRTFNGEYAIEPNYQLVKNLQNFLDIVDESKLYKICTTLDNICWASIDDKVLNYMNKMHNNIYSHIPILEDGKVVGIFGESTFFNWALDSANNNDICTLDHNITFRDLEEYLDYENQEMEEFCFLSKRATIIDAQLKIKEVFNSEKRRLGMIFITENGKPDEKLIGLITPYGLISRDRFY